MAITPFKVRIPDSELELLHQKLKLSRIPVSKVDWRDDNGIDPNFIRTTVDYWLKEYDWRSEEAIINQLPQFMTQIEVDKGFGTLDVHFVHSTSTVVDAVPLLFVHGWPGSFIEIAKGLPLLNKAGFHVVAPSLPGYGFSSYSRKKGFDIRQHAEVLQKLMLRLGYTKFVIQGGDWGSHISRAVAIMYPENVLAMHLNMFQTPRMTFPDGEPEYTAFEKRSLDRHYNWFMGSNTAYAFIHASKPTTLGFAMHDSPVGMLAWMYDKLVLWSDSYPWTSNELITWTLLHYFPGPTTSFMMYTENTLPATMVEGSWAQEYIKPPSGFSAFPKELAIMPRCWAERLANVVFYREHDHGGHFAMYETPEVLVHDVVEFVKIALGG